MENIEAYKEIQTYKEKANEQPKYYFKVRNVNTGAIGCMNNAAVFQLKKDVKENVWLEHLNTNCSLTHEMWFGNDIDERITKDYEDWEIVGTRRIEYKSEEDMYKIVEWWGEEI